MKILIVNFSDIQGGAARAANRLHKSLLDAGIDSSMLVQNKSSDDFRVIAPSSGIKKLLAKIQSLVNPLPLKFYKPDSPFSPSFAPSFGIVEMINNLNPDIVHLHWINAGMLNIEDLEKIKAPIVWSLHDNWGFTGGCHIMWDCEKYKQECGSCPRLNSTNKFDLSYRILSRKKRSYSKIKNLTIVGLSKWLTQCAKESSLFKDRQVVNLPNPINTNIFKAIDKNSARGLYNLPENKKLILFGAVLNATSDTNKGFQYLKEALKQLKDRDVELVIVGASEPKEAQDFGYKTHYVGKLNDDISIVALYSAVDLLIVPSKQENLSNMIMESMSCSTPVVAFDIGGNSDMIEHKSNGFLVKPYDSLEMADGISWLLNHNEYDSICNNARKKVLESFSNEVVSGKYINLYNKILGEN